MKRNIFTFAFLMSLAVILSACGGGGASLSKFPGTEEGANSLLKEFMKPGVDTKKLTMELRPTKEDYRAFYKEEATADRAEAYFDKLWSGGDAVVAPKEGQTELKIAAATTEQLRDPAGFLPDFPGGLKALSDDLKPGLTIYAFKFVKPGETTGMAYEGLTHINGKWRLFPKAWRFLEGK